MIDCETCGVRLTAAQIIAAHTLCDPCLAAAQREQRVAAVRDWFTAIGSSLREWVQIIGLVLGCIGWILWWAFLLYYGN